MDVQGGSDQKQQGLSRTEFAKWKVSEALELAASMVPGHARPIVQTLQGQVNVFIGLEFDDTEPARAGDGQHINHGAVGGGKSGYLGIETCRFQLFLHGSNILDHQ